MHSGKEIRGGIRVNPDESKILMEVKFCRANLGFKTMFRPWTVEFGFAVVLFAKKTSTSKVGSIKKAAFLDSLFH